MVLFASFVIHPKSLLEFYGFSVHVYRSHSIWTQRMKYLACFGTFFKYLYFVWSMLKQKPKLDSCIHVFLVGIFSVFAIKFCHHDHHWFDMMQKAIISSFNLIKSYTHYT
ncbi:hypothetical protein DERP_014983 [Dermatophagoides pteronyssinus]|uniref:Uncharacterized protein n=1 Tax=Dermatophagoides pteronyssinus TaxID=6956 RepID=A0ABQ8JWM4_DERPT|nr:hypothetical protein DERP_014983 [Dermatophagoides pteronyssinus]